MIKSSFKLQSLLITCIFLSFPLSFAQVANNDLYKWKDHEGVWHYSKIPPQDSETNAKNIEVAKESKTIIFEKASKKPVVDKTIELEQEKQIMKGKILNCQLAGRSLLDSALALRKLNDKALQEKTVNEAEYNKEKTIIIKLEDIGSDTELTDNCLADFTKRPEVKDIYNCVIDNIKIEDQRTCLKKYIPTK